MQQKEARQMGNKVDGDRGIHRDSGDRNNGSDSADSTSVSGYRIESAVPEASGRNSSTTSRSGRVSSQTGAR